MPYILIVEDDKSLADWIGDYLLENHFDIAIADRGDEAIELVKMDDPDMVLLDINLPVKDGFEVCSQLRRFYSKPILMLTARGDESDEVIGFEMGANDYMVKPVRPKALVTRINRLLERGSAALKNQIVREFGELKIDSESRSVLMRNSSVELSTHEFDLLWLLSGRAGEVFTREEIVEQMRGIEYDGFNRSVDIMVSRLRKKLDDDSAKPTKIKTVWGKGYVFALDAW
ncbi:MAG: response regulator transcription factor [Gammaproteobacteria bacterium]|nr:response regulator transcription factor [Gammaproteobacteria bacterium]